MKYSLMLFPKFFNSLFFLQRANKKLSILLGCDIAIQSLNYHLAFIGCMNHAVLALIQSDILAYLDIGQKRLPIPPAMIMICVSLYI